MSKRLITLFKNHLRWRIALTISVVIAIVVSVLIIDVTRHNEQQMYKRSDLTARALGQSVAASSAVWMLSRDYSGIQEIIQGLKNYPDLRYAIVLSKNGLVVAHSELNLIGKYLQDLPSSPEIQSLPTQQGMVDVAVPILVDNKLLGWVRLSIGSQSLIDAQNRIRLHGALYALAAMLLGALIAYFSAKRLSFRLDHITQIADGVQAGNTRLRANLKGNDETGRLGSAFDTMLDTLERQQNNLASQNTLLANHRQLLENEVKIRTQDLVTAREAAEEANKAKGSFIANMSHEIRTPMNAIYGMSHLLFKTSLNDRQKNYVSKIMQSGEHLLGIINDILDYSKIEAGKLLIEETEFEFERVINNVGNLISDKANEKGLELIFDIANDVPECLIGDPLRLSQILVNFGNNAVKFTDEGEVRISVKVIERSTSHVTLKIEVSDTGIGLNAEQQSRLFQSFQQADVSTTRKYGGTGLGLAICKRLTELMHGEIGVRSELGKGSSFWLNLRFGIAKSAIKPIHTIESKGVRVLVVDDHAGARESLQELLIHLGFSVDTANSGEVAIQAIRNAASNGSPFRIVLLDWKMPTLSGIDTARHIFDLNLAYPPTLALVTAYGREEVLREAEAAGIEHVMFKPIPPSVLNDTLTDILCQHPNPTLTQKVILSESPFFGSQRILLAEDNVMNQEFAQELLELLGLEIDIAVNGRDAITLVETNSYALILMDMQMPEMDGIEATQHIRQMKHANEIPIIAMTANVSHEDRKRCFDAGMNDFIAKPIIPDNLYKILQRWLTALPPSNSDTDTNNVIPLEPVHQHGFLTRLPEGIDTQSGLKFMGGDAARYQRQLRRYISTQQNLVPIVLSALQDQDWHEAIRLVHTLKGSSAQIGAHWVSTQAAEFQIAFQEHRIPMVQLHELDLYLNNLLRNISDNLDSTSTVNNTSSLESHGLMTELMNLLSDDNARAVSFMEQNQIHFIQILGAEGFQEIFKKVSVYDFERALSLLSDYLPNKEPQ
jgi:two-component system sensor histidine kinase/response regulator